MSSFPEHVSKMVKDRKLSATGSLASTAHYSLKSKEHVEVPVKSMYKLVASSGGCPVGKHDSSFHRLDYMATSKDPLEIKERS